MPWPKGKPFPADHLAKRVASFKANGGKLKKPVVAADGVRWHCNGCDSDLPASAFAIDARNKNGLHSYCRDCSIRITVETRDMDLARASDARYRRRAFAKNPERFRSQWRAASLKKAARHPRRVAARLALNAAVRRGDVVRPSECQRCGAAGKVQGHHHDYSKPLDVEWICTACHGREHRKAPTVVRIEFKALEAGR